MKYTKTMKQAIQEAKQRLNKKHATDEVGILAFVIWRESRVK